MTRRNAIPFLALVVALFIVTSFYSGLRTSDTWRDLPQHVGLGEHLDSAANDDPSKDTPSDPDYANWNPKLVFTPGSPMPPGHNYTSTLVIARTKDENIDWIREKMPDQELAVYVADDPSAPLHPPKNKGHEVMIYLSYIIDHYDNLPDVSIFMHAHQLAWHNDLLLGSDAHQLVNRLSLPHVWRKGYVNMRCSWDPGCPDWQHPGETVKNEYKQEEVLLAKSWSELFPLDDIHEVLAQPCCAQFAISRERIQAKPYAQYVWYRDWMFNTQIPDSLSGRVWEYVWQYVFTGQNVLCPKEHMCYCEQYGFCFGGEEEYDNFIALQNELAENQSNYQDWENQRVEAEQAAKEGLKSVEPPEPGKDAHYIKEIERLEPIIERLIHDAQVRGLDPKNRALEAGREWKEGDGF